MRKIAVDIEAARIEINGVAFELQMSDGDICHAGRAVLARCAALDVNNPDAVRGALEMICGTLDDMLGRRAVAKIMQSRPINMVTALRLLNGVIEDCNARYTAYIRREYLDGVNMRRFSLSSRQSLPEEAEGYQIRTDFRDILRIFRMLDDVEIAEADKGWLLRRLFFVGDFPADAERCFAWFVGMGREARPGSGVRDFDYEQDAAEIYSAFLQTYGVDLIDVPNLHWWRFLPMLEGVFAGDNALSNKVRIRHVDDGENEKKAALNRQKMAVALTQAVGREEANLTALLTERLEKGLPVGDLLKR